MDRPWKNAFTASIYSEEKFVRLFIAVEDPLIEVPVKLSAFYGLRRSEALGLKWDAIDFDRNTISIRHTVTRCSVGGRYTIVAADTTKTKSSRRTLPLVAPVRKLLLNLREQQAENRKLCGKSCCKENDG